MLTRRGLLRLAECDPLTGQRISATRHTTRGYEHPHAGGLLHLDVEKSRPEAAWRAHSRNTRPGSHRGPGLRLRLRRMDDSRLAYTEVLEDECGTTCTGFLLRATAWFARHGVKGVHRVLTYNAKDYLTSRDFAAAIKACGAFQRAGCAQCAYMAAVSFDPTSAGRAAGPWGEIRTQDVRDDLRWLSGRRA